MPGDRAGRFATAGAFASYTGTAPIEVSSGDAVRHRLSRAGNRKLNTALHLVAHVQRMHPGPGHDYYRRKIDEGKSPRGGHALPETTTRQGHLPPAP